MKKIKILFIASALLVAFGCNKEENPSEENLISFEEFTFKGVSFKMIKVEGGTFTMGGTPEQGADAEDYEYPVHPVTLSDYYIGQYEVTQELWKAVMVFNPSYYNGNSKNPVEKVSWNDIVNDFLPKLNKLTGKTFTLPTEAQWEFAARGGNKSQHYTYSGSNNIDDVAWYDGNNSSFETKPVGQKKPNELGLYDMSGNVYEWCSDWYGSYSSSAQTDPVGPSSGSRRVLRGGSYIDSAWDGRVSDRLNSQPDDRYDSSGFRLALAL